MTTTKELNEFVKLDEELCRDVKRFIDLFYDAMDRKRDKIGFLYTEDASLVWNGNAVEGGENVAKFITQLPETKHELVCVDAQRLPESSADLPKSILVTTAGETNIKGINHAFTQTFCLIVEGEKYKIRSDRFRYVD